MRKIYYKLTNLLPKNIKVKLDLTLANCEWREQQKAKLKVFINRLKRSIYEKI